MTKSTCMVVALLTIAAGCGDDGGRPERDGGTDSGPGFDTGVPGCDAAIDTDADGIADSREGDGDADGDGIPNLMDLDSDGDGLTDAEEARSTNPCAPGDSDLDGIADFADRDSDNDGLPDDREIALGTDPQDTDTDHDGFTDLAEDAAGTDPTDPADVIPEDDFFVVLPYNGDHAIRTLRFGTNIRVADVFFLVDMTGSMRGVRAQIITGLIDTIIPGMAAAIPDVQFGAGGYDDYPIPSYGWDPDSMWRDRPFYLLREIAPVEQDIGAWSLSASASVCPMDPAVFDIGRITGAPNGRFDILEAVEGLPCHGGYDGPESTGPALWSTATGTGLRWTHPIRGAESWPDQMCPSIPDEVSPRFGYPCFRPGAQPIILVFGDNPWHNGLAGGNPYSSPPIPEAPTYDQVATELNDIGARVISIVNTTFVPAEYMQISIDTGAVRADGSPLVFTIPAGGTGLDTAVVDAVRQLVSDVPQDVSTRTANVPGNPDGFDATRFIKSITPLEGYDASGRPGVGYTSKDATTFYGVIPGTLVDFEIDFWNDVRPPADVAQVFRARIIVVGNGVTDLDERMVYIIVPPEGVSIPI